MQRTRRVVPYASYRLAVVAAAGFALAACGDKSPPASTESIVPTPGPSTAIATPFNNAGQCMTNDVASFGGGPTNCTANDIRIARADVSEVNDNVVVPNAPIQCTPGTNIKIAMTAVLEATSTSQRDDIGVWIATDGGDAKSGQCRHYNLVNGSPGTVGEASNQTADACAGMAAGAQTSLDLDEFEIPCNPVAQPDGSLVLKIGSCLSWKVPGQDELCPRSYTNSSATYTANDFRAATIPGTPAKCNCEGFTIPVQVVSSITIVKDALPDDAQDFSYTVGGAGMTNFTLDDDPSSATPTNTKVFSGLVNNGSARTITEDALPSGWSLTNLACVSSGATSTIVTNVATRTATVTLRGGENVTCTYTNTATASLVVEKQTVGGTGTFGFTTVGSGLSGFSRNTAGANPTTSTPIEFSGADVAGDKYITEATLPAGWSISNIQCSANGATIAIGTGTGGAFSQGTGAGYQAGENTIKVTLAPGSSPSCTYTNTLAATITVAKVCVGGSGSFDYTGTVPGGGSLGAFNLACAASSQRVSTTSAFGTYSVAETVPAGWDLTSATCTGGGADATNPASIGLQAGENVTCTFTNTRQAQLRIAKVTVPANDPADFTFTRVNYGSNATFELSHGESNASGFLAPGTYGATETVPTGWDLTGRACVLTGTPTAKAFSPTASGVSVTLAAGEDVTCTFTNTKRGTVIIEKQTVPDGAPGSFAFTQSIDGTGGFNLADNGQKTYSNVLPNTAGGYTVTESDPMPAYDLQSISCDNPDGLSASTTNVGSRSATIRVNAGETVKCVFTNRYRSTLELRKVENGGLPLSRAWEFQLRTGASFGTPGTVVASASANVTTGVVQFAGSYAPGAYQLCEINMPAGYYNNITGFTPGGAVEGTDNSSECVAITLAPGANGPGGILGVPNPINNVQPPGGDARTIGYWKNWSSCTGGQQYAKALQRDDWDRTLDGNLPQTIGVLTLAGAPAEGQVAAGCQDAVDILDKSNLSGRKMASDPAYNMAAQLLAALLNKRAGAQQCPAVTAAMADGQALLVAIGFDGTGNYRNSMTAAQIIQANTLAATLDSYNNNTLCSPP